jgi:hypothetical protein
LRNAIMNSINSTVKRYIKTPSKYALPMLFIGLLVLIVLLRVYFVLW